MALRSTSTGSRRIMSLDPLKNPETHPPLNSSGAKGLERPRKNKPRKVTAEERKRAVRAWVLQLDPMHELSAWADLQDTDAIDVEGSKKSARAAFPVEDAYTIQIPVSLQVLTLRNKMTLVAHEGEGWTRCSFKPPNWQSIS